MTFKEWKSIQDEIDSMMGYYGTITGKEYTILQDLTYKPKYREPDSDDDYLEIIVEDEEEDINFIN